MDLRIIAVSMKFEGCSVVTFLRSQRAPSAVSPDFVRRVNATWVPNQLTLTLFNVTAAEEGEYRCEVLSFGVSTVQIWIRTIHVSLLGRLSQLVKRMVINSTYLQFLFFTLLFFLLLGWEGEGRGSILIINFIMFHLTNCRIDIYTFS